MRTAFVIGFAAASIGLAPTFVYAQGQTKDKGADSWYVAATGDVSFLNATGGTIANAPTPGSTVVTQNPIKTGWGGGLAVGRGFGPFRVEGEVGYTRNTQSRYVSIVPATGSITADVKDDAIRGMVNGYYDLAWGRLRPYVGAGVGAARIDIDFFAPRAPFPTEAPRQLIKNGQTRFAYQLMTGVAVPVSKRLALTAQYRWFDAGTVDTTDLRGQQTTRDHAGHNLDLGLRFKY